MQYDLSIVIGLLILGVNGKKLKDGRSTDGSVGGLLVTRSAKAEYPDLFYCEVFRYSDIFSFLEKPE